MMAHESTMDIVRDAARNRMRYCTRMPAPFVWRRKCSRAGGRVDFIVVKAPDVLAALEAEEQARVDRTRTYHDALGVYVRLWNQARRLNPDIGADWRADVQVDIDVTRLLRGARKPR
jgi:hypothetical protein